MGTKKTFRVGSWMILPGIRISKKSTPTLRPKLATCATPCKILRLIHESDWQQCGRRSVRRRRRRCARSSYISGDGSERGDCGNCQHVSGAMADDNRID